MDINYVHRSIRDWLRLAYEGRIALPEFQRSYVWKDRDEMSVKFLQALVEQRPTGTLLILGEANKGLLKSRQLPGHNAQIHQQAEYVLDGQQRLTTLWRAFRRQDNGARFYARFKDINAINLNTCRIEIESKSSKETSNPEEDYAKNRVPLDVLFDPKEADSKGARNGHRSLLAWCKEVGKGQSNVDLAIDIYTGIIDSLSQHLFNDVRIWHCEIRNRISRGEAAQLFITMNSSAVPVNIFDIVVAMAAEKQSNDAKQEEHVRSEIKSIFGKYPELPNYFPFDEDKYIPAVGEWLLKIGCIHEEKPPRESSYESVLIGMLGQDDTERPIASRLDEYAKDGEFGLEKIKPLGAVNDKLVPRWPAVHAIATLRSSYDRASQEAKGGKSKIEVKIALDRLIEAYFWLSAFTRRYVVQGNDRLLEDFQNLCSVFMKVGQGKDPELDRVPIFRTEVYPVPDSETMANPRMSDSLAFINRSGAGRGFACLLISQAGARDWATGESLDGGKVQNLDKQGKLDRHHIFPRNILSGITIGKLRSEDFSDNGLNGALLMRPVNRFYSGDDPRDYLHKTLELKGGPTEKQLRKHLESQLLDFDQLTGRGSVKKRFQEMLERRALLLHELLAPRIDLKKI